MLDFLDPMIDDPPSVRFESDDFEQYRPHGIEYSTNHRAP